MLDQLDCETSQCIRSASADDIAMAAESTAYNANGFNTFFSVRYLVEDEGGLFVLNLIFVQSAIINEKMGFYRIIALGRYDQKYRLCFSGR